MRKGGDRRGSNRDRRARKLWLLATFDADLGPDECRCRLNLSDRCLGLLDYATVTADRLDMGGSYTRDNVQPACGNCQNRQGGLATYRGALGQLHAEYLCAREEWEIEFERVTNQTYRPGIIATERRKERRGGRREVTDYIAEFPPPMFREWLTAWHAARREQVA